MKKLLLFALTFLYGFALVSLSQNIINEIGVRESNRPFAPDNNKGTIKLKHSIKDTVVLTHSADTSFIIEKLIKKEFIVLFDNPVLATFFFKRDTLKKLVNYHMLNKKLVTENEKGNYSSLKFNPRPDSIHFNGNSFVVTEKGMILEKIMPASTNLFISYESNYTLRQVDDFSDINEIKDKYQTGSVAVIVGSKTAKTTTTFIICEAQPNLYHFNGKKYNIITNQKKFLSILDDNKRYVASNYLNTNSFSINNVNDIEKFVCHVYDYKKPTKEIVQNLAEENKDQEVKSLIPKEIEQNVAKKDSILKQELNSYMGKMLTNNQISENIETTVVTNVIQEKNELGEDELNLHVEYGYRVIKASIDNQTDDYPAGKYGLINSNAAKITCQILKQTLENDLEEFLLPDTRVSIRITGSTDGTPISSTIPYDDDFGDIKGYNYFVNNSLENITVTQKSGINSNQQLAFLRTYGVRQFIETFVEPLKFTKNTYSHYAVIHKELGAQYRRITVHFTIHNAFDVNKYSPTPKPQKMESVSDVDVNIPQSTKTYPNKFALIIGNEDYSSRQSGLNSESNVAFAVKDAEVFKKYCIETLGFEERNVFLITNATSAEMNQKIDLVTQIINRIGNVTDLFFYYAGHGFPDELTREPYLMPVDVSASYLPAAVKLSDVYKKLSMSGAEKVTVFLDACFSGGGREAGLLAARAVKVRPKEEVITGNLVVFSATSNDQSALPFKDKKHGMFTYYLLKKLQETGGEVDYGTLDAYIFKNVSIESLRVNSKAQDPKTSFSHDAEDYWKTWKFR